MVSVIKYSSLFLILMIVNVKGLVKTSSIDQLFSYECRATW